ncbi:hypothetical protein OG218_00325 [Kineococcus sp. NBC_00420]|uniref:hypothetical protein n=1 Tax=Kineococcus sp. NBC_00420 TaxID=2903564 RepID=UPI002E20D894
MRRYITVLAAAVTFGAVLAVCKDPAGTSTGVLHDVRATVGNLSTPWLLLPLLAGSVGRSRTAGALWGLLTTFIGLGAFYVVVGLSIGLDGQRGFAAVPGWALANAVYFEAGVVTGPLFGALGAWWQLRGRRAGRASATRVTRFGWWRVTAVLLVGEPLVLFLLGYAAPLSESWRGQLPALLSLPLMWGRTVDRSVATWVYAIELGLGVVLLLTAWRRPGIAFHARSS